MHLGTSISLTRPTLRRSSGVLTLTNAQKLSLPANTPVGTRVQVTDGFALNGTGDASLDMLWILVSANLYRPVDVSDPENDLRQCYSYDQDGERYWKILDSIGDNVADVEDDADFPWLVADWGIPITLTHPAVQQLAAPSTAQIGVALFGSSGPANVGIFTKRSVINGRDAFRWFGDSTDTLLWWTGTQWQYDNGLNNGDDEFHSTDDVLHPWLITTWQAGQSDPPTSNTVITQGETDAGVLVTGAGTSSSNGPLIAVNPQAGCNAYALVGRPSSQMDYVSPGWDFYDDVLGTSSYNSANNFAFPWLATWAVLNGSAPAPTVTRNDVASESNWEVVT